MRWLKKQKLEYLENTAMGISGSSQHCHHKYHPMLDLQWHKIAVIRFPMFMVFTFTTYITVDYF